MCYISENVRIIRERLGFSQKELAERIGISHSRISEIENQKGEPRITTIEKVAHGLGVTILELMKPPRKKS